MTVLLRRRFAILGLLAALAAPTLCSADTTTVLMKDGKRIDLQEFRQRGELLEGTLTSGRPWSAPLGQVDFLQTFMENFSTQRGDKGIYLSRGKLLTFEEIQVHGRQADLKLSDGASVTIPVDVIDFQLTVIESRGQQAGAKVRPSSGVTRPRTVSAAGSRPTSLSASGRDPRARTWARREETGEETDRDAPQPPTPAGGVFDAARRGFQTPDPIDRRQEEEMGGMFGEQENDQDPEQVIDGGGGGGGGGGTDNTYPRRITRAEVVQKVDPIYDPNDIPEESRGLTALFEVTVGTSGTVTNVKVIKSTGKPTLDQAGVEAVQQYIYSPAENDGVPFESRRLERISFSRQ